MPPLPVPSIVLANLEALLGVIGGLVPITVPNRLDARKRGLVVRSYTRRLTCLATADAVLLVEGVDVVIFRLRG